MKKHEVILAGYAGKMIVLLPDTTNGTSGSGFHEPDVLSRYDIPPRSAEVLWDLAKKRRYRL